MTRKIILLLTACGAAAAQRAVPVNRYDAAATGANTVETILRPDNVSAATFGKLYSYYVDGAVFAQPLYVPDLAIPGRGAHDVLFVATMNDRIYAFDAHREGPPLWMRNLTDEMAGVTPVPVADITHNPDLNIVGNAGIEGTPVIDPASRSIFFVARTKERTKEKDTYVQRLYKLDVATGRDKAPPRTIEASGRGTASDAVNGMVRFDAMAGNQRTALALVNGHVVIAWASHEDIRPYHGWIMAYDATTLQQTAALCITPNGEEGGVWQSGRGPAVDASDAIYFETGNGTFDGEQEWGTSLLKLRTGKGGFAVEDFFTPHDFEALNRRDLDLGSSGPMLIPGTNYLIAGSKKGVLYLLDKDHLGHVSAEDPGVLQTVEVSGGRVLAGPAWWNNTLYLWNDADSLKAYRFDGQRLEATPSAKGSIKSSGSPGGALTVTADGTKSGTGIVWAMLTINRSAGHGNAPGALRAFDAETLRELWGSDQEAKRDRLGTLVKFNPPLVVAGKVYAATYDNAVNVYGLLPK